MNPGKLGVGQRIDERLRLRAMTLGALRRSHDRIRKGETGERARGQRSVAQGAAPPPRHAEPTPASRRISHRQRWFLGPARSSAPPPRPSPGRTGSPAPPPRRAPASSCRPRRLLDPCKGSRDPGPERGCVLRARASPPPAALRGRPGNGPPLSRALARASSSSTARPPEPSAGAGARHPRTSARRSSAPGGEASSPGFPRTATASTSPSRAERRDVVGARWRQRPHAPAVPRRTVRGHRASSLPPSSRTPPCAPAGAGSGNAVAPRWSERDPLPSSSSTASIAAVSEVAAAAAASSGSNGAPPDSAPSSTRRRPRREAPAPPRATATAERNLAERELGRGGGTGRAVERPRELLEVQRVAAALVEEDGCVCARDLLAEQLAVDWVALNAPSSICNEMPSRFARSSAVERRSGILPRAMARALSAPRPTVGGGAARRGARRTPSRPSGDRRGRGRAAARTRAARAARAPPGGCGSARAGRRRRARPQASSSEGKTCASSVRTSSSRRSSEAGSRLRRYSSSASTKTEKGRSRSSSEAEPERTRRPCASARPASSASRRVLPIPGSPTSSIAAARSSSPRVRSIDSSSSTRPTKCSLRRDISRLGEDSAGVPAWKVRVRDQGGRPMSGWVFGAKLGP